MIPTGRISVNEPDGEDPFDFHAEIVLGPDVVTCRDTDDPDDRWTTRPLRSLRFIEWDDFPFQPEGGDEIAFLQQWISNLSPDELEAAVDAEIGMGGLHRQGEWIKAALMKQLPQ